MKLAKRIICGVLIAMFIAAAIIPIVTLTSNAATTYVSNGLVAHYDGDDRGTSDTVWKDKVGNNDFTITKDANNYFNNEGLYVTNQKHTFPTAIKNVVNSNEFTVELLLSDFVSTGIDYNTFFNTSNDAISLFNRNNKNHIEIKLPGVASADRIMVADGMNMLQNALVTLTFKVGDKAKLYIDGVLCGESAAPQAISSADVFIGHTSTYKTFKTTYRSIRFYNRALNASEVIQNARADAKTPFTTVTNNYVTVAQPKTNIIGDIAMIRRINTAAELSELSSAVAQKSTTPAIAIFTINNSLEVVDDNGVKFSTVYDAVNAMQNKVISAFYVNTVTEAQTLAYYLKGQKHTDFFFVSDNAEAVAAGRKIIPSASGAIDYTDKYKNFDKLTEAELITIRREVRKNFGYVAILPMNVCSHDTVQKLFNMSVNVWAVGNDSASLGEALDMVLCGAIGVVSDALSNLWLVSQVLVPENTLTRAPLNVGHRGISDAPDNTLEGFKLAYESGANAIELDIHMTSDNHIVVHHGTDSGFTSGCSSSLEISKSTLAQIQALTVDAKGSYTSCKIPTLQSVFDYFKDKDIQLFIEIKSKETGKNGGRNIIPTLKKLIEDNGIYGKCTVIGYNDEGQFAQMREYYPEMPLSQLRNKYMMEAYSDEAQLRSQMSYIGLQNSQPGPDHTRANINGNDVRATLMRGISINPYGYKDGTKFDPSKGSAIADYQTALLGGFASITGDDADLFAKLPTNIALKNTISKEYTVGDTLDISSVINNYLGETIDATPTVINAEGNNRIKRTNNNVECIGSGKVALLLTYTHSLSQTSTDKYTVCVPVVFNIKAKNVTPPPVESDTDTKPVESDTTPVESQPTDTTDTDTEYTPNIEPTDTVKQPNSGKDKPNIGWIILAVFTSIAAAGGITVGIVFIVLGIVFIVRGARKRH